MILQVRILTNSSLHYAFQPKISTAKLLSGTNYWGRAHLAKIWEYTLKQFI